MSQTENRTGIRSISVEMWHSLTREGTDLPVTIQLQGSSMHPLIRIRRDHVTIRPIRRLLIRGDIVLFRRPDGVYVVHRIRKILSGTVQTLGDHCDRPDAPIPCDQVLGLVTHVTRGKRTFCVDTPFWRFLGRRWSSLLPLRQVRRRLSCSLKTLIPHFRR